MPFKYNIIMMSEGHYHAVELAEEMQAVYYLFHYHARTLRRHAATMIRYVSISCHQSI